MISIPILGWPNERRNGKLGYLKFVYEFNRSNYESKFLKSWLTGHLQGITIDTKSLMLPGIILFFLAQPKSQERACFLNA